MPGATRALAIVGIPSEAKRSRGMERLGKPRHRREDRRLSEGEVSESIPALDIAMSPAFA